MVVQLPGKVTTKQKSISTQSPINAKHDKLQDAYNNDALLSMFSLPKKDQLEMKESPPGRLGHESSFLPVGGSLVSLCSFTNTNNTQGRVRNSFHSYKWLLVNSFSFRELPASFFIIFPCGDAWFLIVLWVQHAP
ncbi:hypothetical protein EJ110_NYTH08463 [Nymphaea thermarum]|nr:hypothetical protein EJ110_NYTH08463 [Nymphaea thermarum]